MLKALFRLIAKEDINFGEGEYQGKDHTGDVTTLTKVNASQLPLTQSTDDELGLAAGSTVEDGLVKLKNDIPEVPTTTRVDDDEVDVLPSTTDYIGLTPGKTQNEVTKYLFDKLSSVGEGDQYPISYRMEKVGNREGLELPSDGCVHTWSSHLYDEVYYSYVFAINRWDSRGYDNDNESYYSSLVDVKIGSGVALICTTGTRPGLPGQVKQINFIVDNVEYSEADQVWYLCTNDINASGGGDTNDYFANFIDLNFSLVTNAADAVDVSGKIDKPTSKETPATNMATKLAGFKVDYATIAALIPNDGDECHFDFYLEFSNSGVWYGGQPKVKGGFTFARSSGYVYITASGVAWNGECSGMALRQVITNCQTSDGGLIETLYYNVSDYPTGTPNWNLVEESTYEYNFYALSWNQPHEPWTLVYQESTDGIINLDSEILPVADVLSVSSLDFTKMLQSKYMEYGLNGRAFYRVLFDGIEVVDKITIKDKTTGASYNGVDGDNDAMTVKGGVVTEVKSFSGGYVPYTGATSDVDLGDNELFASNVILTVSEYNVEYSTPSLTLETVYCSHQLASGRLLVGTGYDTPDRKVYYSDNDGLTWNESSIPIIYDTIRTMTQLDSGRILAGSGSGDDSGYIYYSDDNGLTFTKSTTDFLVDDIFCITQLLSGRVLVGVGKYSNIPVFYSDDDGNTWNNFVISPTVKYIRTIVQTSGGRILAGTKNTSNVGVIFYSDDNGSTWTDFNIGFTVQDIYSISELLDERILVGTGVNADYSDVYYSDDNFLTFTKVEIGSQIETITSTIMAAGGRVLIGTGSGVGDGYIYYSDDNGSTFTQFNIDVNIDIINSIIQLDTGRIIFTTGSGTGDGRVYYSDNLGIAKTSVATENHVSTNYQPIMAKNEANGYVGLNENSLIDTQFLPSYVDGKFIIKDVDINANPLIDGDFLTGLFKILGAIRFNNAWEDDNFDPTMLTGNGNLPVSRPWASTGCHVAGFSGSQVDEVEIIKEMPHSTALNATGETTKYISFHFHFATEDTVVGNMRFGLEYFFEKENVPVTTSTTIYITVPTTGVAWAKKSASFANIPVPDELGAQGHYRFFRLGNDALDTYTGYALIGTVGYHYNSDSCGSDEMLSKT